MDDTKEKWQEATDAQKKATVALAERQPNDDMELAKAICNMAIDVTKGDRPNAINYLTFVKLQCPALTRLFARVGYDIVEGQLAQKH